MAKAFELEFGEPLVVISGYRSAEYQQRLWNLGRCHDTLCAPPGYSEHQLGLAVDIFDASTN
jgi:LAS superfamily LD-carboxypeptidase LdcB